MSGNLTFNICLPSPFLLGMSVSMRWSLLLAGRHPRLPLRLTVLSTLVATACLRVALPAQNLWPGYLPTLGYPREGVLQIDCEDSTTRKHWRACARRGASRQVRVRKYCADIDSILVLSQHWQHIPWGGHPPHKDPPNKSARRPPRPIHDMDLVSDLVPDLLPGTVPDLLLLVQSGFYYPRF